MSHEPASRGNQTFSAPHSPLHLRWHSSKEPGFGRDSSVSSRPGAASAEETAEERACIPKPGGSVKAGTAAPAEDGGGGELAARTLPILPGRRDTATWSDTFHAAHGGSPKGPGLGLAAAHHLTPAGDLWLTRASEHQSFSNGSYLKLAWQRTSSPRGRHSRPTRRDRATETPARTGASHRV